VNIDYCRVLKGQTGYTIVELKNGNRFFIEDNLGVQINFYIPSDLQEILSSSKINFYSGFTSWKNTNIAIDQKFDIKKIDLDVLKKINGISKHVAFDFSNITDFDFIKLLAPYINLAFLSIDPSSNHKPKNFAEKIIDFFRKGSVLIITMGKKGSIAFIGNKIVTQNQIEADVVDTLGCGDAFIGAFLSEYIKSEGDIKKCLLRGTQVATEELKRFGAW
jgi:fructoselysine 6-kinase